MIVRWLQISIAILWLSPAMGGDAQLSTTAAVVWQPVSLDFTGPEHAQTDSEPNPFLDYRLQVQFTAPSGNSLNVPGHFDGDGKGGPQGNVWRVRFLPTEPGEWTYRVSFRKGP